MKLLSAVSLLLVVTLSTSACDPPAPEWVWVPAPDFEATLHVWVGDEPGESLRVEEWINLHANRSTGPWIRAKYKDLPADARWLTRPPEEREENVEANVHWYVEPSGYHKLNLPTAPDILTRQIQFSEPGQYKIWAESHTWGGGQVESNVVEISIRP